MAAQAPYNPNIKSDNGYRKKLQLWPDNRFCNYINNVEISETDA